MSRQWREWIESVVSRILLNPIGATGVAFVGELIQKKNLRAALKEARYVWRLEVKRNQNGKDRKL